MKTININNKTYKWKCGKSFVVIIDPNNRKYLIKNHIIKGNKPDDFDKGQIKRTSDGSITPQNITDYITKNNL